MKQSVLTSKIKHYLADFRVVFFVWLIMAIIPWLRIWLKGKFDLDYSSSTTRSGMPGNKCRCILSTPRMVIIFYTDRSSRCSWHPWQCCPIS